MDEIYGIHQLIDQEIKWLRGSSFVKTVDTNLLLKSLKRVNQKRSEIKGTHLSYLRILPPNCFAAELHNWRSCDKGSDRRAGL